VKTRKKKISFLTACLIGGTLMFSLAGFAEVFRAHRIETWPKTEAKVTAFSTSIPGGRARIQEYSVDVDYSVNAHLFHARKQAALTSQDRATITNLHQGSVVTLAYNPGNPAEAKIYIGNVGAKYLFLFFMAALCGVSALLAIKRPVPTANP